jgi:hypothetical protein
VKESSFLKKRSKRPLFFRSLAVRGHGLDLAAGAGLKVFWFFSSEKNNTCHQVCGGWLVGLGSGC